VIQELQKQLELQLLSMKTITEEGVIEILETDPAGLKQY
jgi:hypothetical protein